MQLMKINEFREQCFTSASRPSYKTVRRWIDDGEIPSRKIGSTFYIKVDEIDGTSPLVNNVLGAMQRSA